MSLIQRAYWAGGLCPLERGDPLALVGTPNQLLENIHKAACLQKIHERKLIAGYQSPMQLLGLPGSLKPTVILIQKTIAAISPVERLDGFLNNQNNPSVSVDRGKHRIWTWSEVAEELINYSRKYGPVKLPEEKSEKTENPKGVRHIASPN
ncbi:hypothetical protein DV515_00017336, partial [Chloebia gouldiae]